MDVNTIQLRAYPGAGLEVSSGQGNQHGQNVIGRAVKTFRPLHAGSTSVEQQVEEAKELQETFRTFVGESFFGQMLKSMKSTVGKPAYFHGGRAEEIFQGQLNQSMAEDMTKASADTIADPMFRQQFPQQAKLLREAEENQKNGFADLDQLRRR